MSRSGEGRDALDSTVATLLRVLDEMGIADLSEDAVVTAPPFNDGPVLLEGRGRFGQFAGRMAVELRFVPGDLHIHLLGRVERREPGEPFYELGGRCRALAARYAY